MYSAVLILALTGAEPTSVNSGCSARASCHSTTTTTIVTRTTTTTTGCTKAAVANCSNNAGCSARHGLIAKHHERVADRAQARADRHTARAGNCGAGVTIVIQCAPPANEKTPAKKLGEPLGEPKKLN